MAQLSWTLPLLVPAVSPTNTGSNQRFAETSAVPGQGISLAGQRNPYNSFFIDGVSANDDAADLTGTYYSEEVINQFQVITSGGIAEFGRTSGGIVNIITKSGTNDWRGSLYGFARNQRFDAPTRSHPLRIRRMNIALRLRADQTGPHVSFYQLEQTGGIIRR